MSRLLDLPPEILAEVCGFVNYHDLGMIFRTSAAIYRRLQPYIEGFRRKYSNQIYLCGTPVGNIYDNMYIRANADYSDGSLCGHIHVDGINISCEFTCICSKCNVRKKIMAEQVFKNFYIITKLCKCVCVLWLICGNINGRVLALSFLYPIHYPFIYSQDISVEKCKYESLKSIIYWFVDSIPWISLKPREFIIRYYSRILYNFCYSFFDLINPWGEILEYAPVGISALAVFVAQLSPRKIWKFIGICGVSGGYRARIYKRSFRGYERIRDRMIKSFIWRLYMKLMPIFKRIANYTTVRLAPKHKSVFRLQSIIRGIKSKKRQVNLVHATYW